MNAISKDQLEIVFGGDGAPVNVPASTSTRGATTTISCPSGSSPVTTTVDNKTTVVCMPYVIKN